MLLNIHLLFCFPCFSCFYSFSLWHNASFCSIVLLLTQRYTCLCLLSAPPGNIFFFYPFWLFEKEIPYIALPILDLSLWTRLTSYSEIFLLIPLHPAYWDSSFVSSLSGTYMFRLVYSSKNLMTSRHSHPLLLPPLYFLLSPSVSLFPFFFLSLTLFCLLFSSHLGSPLCCFSLKVYNLLMKYQAKYSPVSICAQLWGHLLELETTRRVPSSWKNGSAQ